MATKAGFHTGNEFGPEECSTSRPELLNQDILKVSDADLENTEEVEAESSSLLSSEEIQFWRYTESDDVRIEEATPPLREDVPGKTI